MNIDSRPYFVRVGHQLGCGLLTDVYKYPETMRSLGNCRDDKTVICVWTEPLPTAVLDPRDAV